MKLLRQTPANRKPGFKSRVKAFVIFSILLVLVIQIQAQTLTISSSGDFGTSGTNWTTSGTNPVTITTTGDASLNTSVITGYLNAGTSVILSTTVDIRLTDAISKSSGSEASLTMNAGRDIYIQAGISSTSNALNLTLDADTDNNTIGAITISANITTNGGALSCKDDVSFNGSSAQTISSGSGALAFMGEVMLSNTNGITMTTDNANVTFSSAINSGNSYALDATTKTWDGAYSAHSSSTSYLATITSRMELTAAMSVVPSNGAWLGGSDKEVEGTWKWVTGPELGTIFWKSGTNNTGIKGYVGYNNSFVNWNTGEPNDSGSNEDALQIRNNSDGYWNDLPTGSSTLASVVETELQPSALTINAGTGTVTFGGPVGAGKPLRSLYVNAAIAAINGGIINTDSEAQAGGQTFSGNITLGSASTTLNMLDTPSDFVLASGKSISNATNADASLTIKTTSNIILDTNSSIASSEDKLSTILWADSDANGGYIRTSRGCSIKTRGGHLWMGGGNGSKVWNGLTVGDGYALGNSVNSNGILIIGSSFATDGGNVALYGKSRQGEAVGTEEIGVNQNVDGIRISPLASTSISSGAGSILIDGVSQGTNQVALGVEFCSLSPESHLITSSAISGDAITIIGIGSQSAGTQVNTNGVFVHSGTTISATGGGNIKITGVGGSVGSTQQSTYFSNGSLVNAGSGNLTVIGNTLYLAGTLTGTGNLNIQPGTTATTIGIGSGAGTLQLPSSLFSTNFTDGFSGITIGNADAGDITVNSVTFLDNTRLLNAGKVIVNAGQTVTASNIRLQIDKNLTLGTGAKIVR